MVENKPLYPRFTDDARKSLVLANQQAQRFNHEYICTEHMLLGLIKNGRKVGVRVLLNLGIDTEQIQRQIETVAQPGPERVATGGLPQTQRAKKVLEYALEESRNFGHNYLGTEHLLLGLIREEEGVAGQVLQAQGLTLEAVRDEIRSVL